MSFTETTNRSWFSRIGGSFKGFFVGLLLVIAACVLLFWNEGRAVTTARALAEGAGIVLSVNSAAIDPANDGKLVHISGSVTPNGVPRDSRFGVEAAGAVGLERNVEMYQWRETSRSETRKTLGGGEETVTTYDYDKVWSASQIDSARFKILAGHENPAFPVSNENFTVETVALGAFTIAGPRAASLGASSPIPLSEADATRIGSALGSGQRIRIVNGVADTSFSSANPQIGAIRLGFSASRLDQASFVAAQKAATLEAYTTTNGRSLFLSQSGLSDATAMFADAVAGNTALTWALRIIGLIVMLIAFKMVFAIAGVLADIIPFAGGIVRFGTGMLSLALTALLGSIVIAIGWIVYRPLVGIGILAVGLAIGFVALRLGRKTEAPAANPGFGRQQA
jgi:hypothetical protein